MSMDDWGDFESTAVVTSTEDTSWADFGSFGQSSAKKETPEVSNGNEQETADSDVHDTPAEDEDGISEAKSTVLDSTEEGITREVDAEEPDEERTNDNALPADEGDSGDVDAADEDSNAKESSNDNVHVVESSEHKEESVNAQDSNTTGNDASADDKVEVRDKERESINNDSDNDASGAELADTVPRGELQIEENLEREGSNATASDDGDTEKELLTDESHAEDGGKPTSSSEAVEEEHSSHRGEEEILDHSEHSKEDVKTSPDDNIDENDNDNAKEDVKADETADSDDFGDFGDFSSARAQNESTATFAADFDAEFQSANTETATFDADFTAADAINNGGEDDFGDFDSFPAEDNAAKTKEKETPKVQETAAQVERGATTAVSLPSYDELQAHIRAQLQVLYGEEVDDNVVVDGVELDSIVRETISKDLSFGPSTCAKCDTPLRAFGTICLLCGELTASAATTLGASDVTSTLRVLHNELNLDALSITNLAASSGGDSSASASPARSRRKDSKERTRKMSEIATFEALGTLIEGTSKSTVAKETKSASALPQLDSFAGLGALGEVFSSSSPSKALAKTTSDLPRPQKSSDSSATSAGASSVDLLSMTLADMGLSPSGGGDNTVSTTTSSEAASIMSLFGQPVEPTHVDKVEKSVVADDRSANASPFEAFDAFDTKDKSAPFEFDIPASPVGSLGAEVSFASPFGAFDAKKSDKGVESASVVDNSHSDADDARNDLKVPAVSKRAESPLRNSATTASTFSPFGDASNESSVTQNASVSAVSPFGDFGSKKVSPFGDFGSDSKANDGNATTKEAPATQSTAEPTDSVDDFLQDLPDLSFMQ